jgi:L-alanine-DL-glutamate epimerase-like enolase superfamily enzyme
MNRSMKIAQVKTFSVEGTKYNWTLLEIETEAGIDGWGEATNWPGAPLVKLNFNCMWHEEPALPEFPEAIADIRRQGFMLNDVPWCDSCLSHPLSIEGGFFRLPERPGLGLDLNEAELLKHPGLRVPPADRSFYV